MTKIVLVSKKKLFVLLVILLVAIGGFFWFSHYQSVQKEKEKNSSIYEAMVQLVDEKPSDPKAMSSNFERGDVILLVPEGHQWSDTEKISYLIVKLKLTSEEAQNLIEPETKDVEVDEARKKEIPKGVGPEKETVRARKYQIDLGRLGVKDLTVNDLANGQPTGDKVFDKKVIKKK